MTASLKVVAEEFFLDESLLEDVEGTRWRRPASSIGRMGTPERRNIEAIARDGIAELHTHLGGAVDSAMMWTLAHEQGIALPVKDYWAFDELVTVSDLRGVPNLDALDAIYHWTS